MNFQWTSILDFALLSLFLAIATFFKRRINFFQKYLIPTSIIAGFVGLALVPVAGMDKTRLENMVYHLMAIGFIALALKDRTRQKSKDVGNTGFFIVSTYLVQGIIGLVLTFGLMFILYPDLFPAFGLLLPLGYGQGPGQALSIGAAWEEIGFVHGKSVGLTIATLGFLWACIGGIPFINILVKRKRLTSSHIVSTKELSPVYESDGPGEAPLSESMDKISIQFYLIGIVYLVTYLTIKGLSAALTPLGTFGQTMSTLLWGFHFIIGTVYAILMRVVFDFFKKRKIMTHNYPNNYLLQRISGGCFDFMITASISAISIAALKAYVVPIAMISTLGGVLTAVYIYFMSKRIYENYQLEYMVSLYGMLTGTISTGLALLKEVDPNFDTPIAENLVFGSAVGLATGFPLLLILNIPIIGYKQNQPIMYLYTFLALVVYLFILLLLLFRRSNKSKKVQQKASQS